MRQGQNLKHAKHLRQTLTEAEKRLWYRLRAHRFHNLKFKRQFPIGPYIADFACVEHDLVVELDGGQHATHLAYDRKREDFLQQRGFTVLRFWNNEVLENTDAVLQMIAQHCCVTAPLPNPLPQRAGEGEGAVRG